MQVLERAMVICLCANVSSFWFLVMMLLLMMCDDDSEGK